MIRSDFFGKLPDGRAVTRYRLSDGERHVDILDYGATIQSVVVPDRAGRPTDVVLGYDTAAEYAAGECYFGATIGRHANRIGEGWFELNGKRYELAKNNGPNHSHGGTVGFDKRFFTAKVEGDSLTMELLSPDGEEGYPGTLRLAVTFTFRDGVLRVKYRAVSDRDTVVNLTGHSYFDLSGGNAPMGQLLRLDSDSFTENDENTLPTGRILPVRGTAFDFLSEKPVGRDVGNGEVQLLLCRGYDHNYVLKAPGSLREFAWLRSPETGISLALASDLPGVQLYSGNWIDCMGKGGRHYGPRAGVALEPQFFPNAMHLDGFRKPILRAGDAFETETVYRFGSEN